ncbi:hypothetical protein BJV78DRAFT_261412 [Lactifluus subvellereus]|nr:hypothetical protein BJV78DRAFT_261412 [Lactifluus subvellereus]
MFPLFLNFVISSLPAGLGKVGIGVAPGLVTNSLGGPWKNAQRLFTLILLTFGIFVTKTSISQPQSSKPRCLTLSETWLSHLLACRQGGHLPYRIKKGRLRDQFSDTSSLNGAQRAESATPAEQWVKNLYQNT